VRGASPLVQRERRCWEGLGFGSSYGMSGRENDSRYCKVW